MCSKWIGPGVAGSQETSWEVFAPLRPDVALTDGEKHKPSQTYKINGYVNVCVCVCVCAHTLVHVHLVGGLGEKTEKA